jgi:hypothetical protein
MVGVRAVASRSKYLASRVSFLVRVLESCHGEFIGELLQFSLEVVVPDFAWLEVGRTGRWEAEEGRVCIAMRLESTCGVKDMKPNTSSVARRDL